MICASQKCSYNGKRPALNKRGYSGAEPPPPPPWRGILLRQSYGGQAAPITERGGYTEFAGRRMKKFGMPRTGLVGWFRSRSGGRRRRFRGRGERINVQPRNGFGAGHSTLNAQPRKGFGAGCSMWGMAAEGGNGARCPTIIEGWICKRRRAPTPAPPGRGTNDGRTRATSRNRLVCIIRREIMGACSGRWSTVIAECKSEGECPGIRYMVGSGSVRLR